MFQSRASWLRVTTKLIWRCGFQQPAPQPLLMLCSVLLHHLRTCCHKVTMTSSLIWPSISPSGMRLENFAHKLTWPLWGSRWLALMSARIYTFSQAKRVNAGWQWSSQGKQQHVACARLGQELLAVCSCTSSSCSWWQPTSTTHSLTIHQRFAVLDLVTTSTPKQWACSCVAIDI